MIIIHIAMIEVTTDIEITVETVHKTINADPILELDSQIVQKVHTTLDPDTIIINNDDHHIYQHIDHHIDHQKDHHIE